MTSLNLFPVAEVQSEVRDFRLHRNTTVNYIRLFVSVYYISLTVTCRFIMSTVIKVTILLKCTWFYFEGTLTFFRFYARLAHVLAGQVDLYPSSQ